jgi:hypothetical protein
LKSEICFGIGCHEFDFPTYFQGFEFDETKQKNQQIYALMNNYKITMIKTHFDNDLKNYHFSSEDVNLTYPQKIAQSFLISNYCTFLNNVVMICMMDGNLFAWDRTTLLPLKFPNSIKYQNVRQIGLRQEAFQALLTDSGIFRWSRTWDLNLKINIVLEGKFKKLGTGFVISYDDEVIPLPEKLWYKEEHLCESIPIFEKINKEKLKKYHQVSPHAYIFLTEDLNLYMIPPQFAPKSFPLKHVKIFVPYGSFWAVITQYGNLYIFERTNAYRYSWYSFILIGYTELDTVGSFRLYSWEYTFQNETIESIHFSKNGFAMLTTEGDVLLQPFKTLGENFRRMHNKIKYQNTKAETIHASNCGFLIITKNQDLLFLDEHFCCNFNEKNNSLHNLCDHCTGWRETKADKIQKIVSNDLGFLLLSKDGKMYTFDFETKMESKLEYRVGNETVIDIFATKKAFLGLTASHSIFCYGKPQYGGEIPPHIRSELPFADINNVQSDSDVFCVYTGDNQTFTWGNNYKMMDYARIWFPTTKK